MSNNDSEDQKVEHVSIQPPKFSRAKPSVWFQQTEAQFLCKGITKNNIKYCHALQTLDTDVVAEVSDFTANPSQYGKYEAFKVRVLHIFQDSKEKRLKTLLYKEELGDQRPARFLRCLKELAEGKVSDELLKSLWTQRLPSNMQSILAACGDDLDKLAILADRIHNIASPNVSNLEVAATTATTPSLQSQIDENTRRLDHLTSPRQKSNSRRHSRSRSSSRARSISPSFGW